MELGQLAAHAVRDLMTRLSGAAPAPEAQTDVRTVVQEGPLAEAFSLLADADGWGKLALQRIFAHPADQRAAQDLCVRLEQAARLHPSLARHLAAAVETGDDIQTGRVPAPR